MNSIAKHFPLFLVLIFLNSCAKQNAGIVKQTYHDLTSHYNGYFNAHEQFNNQLKTLQDGNKDDYEQILPLESYGRYEDIKSQNESLNTTIAKARLSIQTHQEKEEGKNYITGVDNSISNWSDDAFVLIGKAYYFQGELDSAINCFRYVTANFEEGVDARSKDKIKKQKNSKKKKAKAKKLEDKLIEKELAGKDIRPSKKLIAHESAYSDALVWLAKAYISNEQYIEAENILTFIRGSQNFLKDYDREVDMVNTYLYFAQGSFNTGINYLDSAIVNTKKQKNKARLQFIAGQVYESLGQKTIAADYYKQSMKGNADFEMIFYAKLKLIQMNRQSPGGENEALKLIAKMSKDNKNRAYYDQLYYEKAMIALNNDVIEDAKKFLLKSAEVSQSNQKQKGISYGTLADIYYEEEDYPIAQAYYDSAVSLLDNSYIAYDVILNRSIVLTELIDYLKIITINDSLLVLGEIPAKELESILYKQAVDIIDAEIKQEEKNKQAQLIASSSTQTSKTSGKNAWYFYSEASRNSGYKKFKQTWGDILLEDDWRRSEKGSNMTADGGDSFETESDEYFARIDAKYQEMINAIPSSEKEKKELRKEIIEAYYNGAVIYKVGLENLPKSAEMFVMLNMLHPDNRYEPEALYQLYVLYTDMNQSAQAMKAKQTLLEKYPDNKFSQFFTNPSSVETKNLEDQATDFYEEAYALYQIKDFDQVIIQCEIAKEKYSQTMMMAKFDLLKAMCMGSKQLRESYISSLEYVVNNHANTAEQEKAEEILSYLNGTDQPVQRDVDQGTIDKLKIDKQIPVNKQSLDVKEQTNSSSDGGVKFKLGSKEVQLGGNKQEEVKSTKGE